MIPQHFTTSQGLPMIKTHSNTNPHPSFHTSSSISLLSSIQQPIQPALSTRLQSDRVIAIRPVRVHRADQLSYFTLHQSNILTSQLDRSQFFSQFRHTSLNSPAQSVPLGLRTHFLTVTILGPVCHSIREAIMSKQGSNSPRTSRVTAIPVPQHQADVSETKASAGETKNKFEDFDTEKLIRYGRTMDDVCLRALHLVKDAAENKKLIRYGRTMDDLHLRALRLVKDATTPGFKPAAGQASIARRYNILKNERLRAESKLGPKLLQRVKGSEVVSAIE